MAVATPDSPAGQIAQALVDFSVEGAFPEESVSSLTVDSDALPAAIEALASAKAKLQVPTIHFSTHAYKPFAEALHLFVGRDTHHQRRNRRRCPNMENKRPIGPRRHYSVKSSSERYPETVGSATGVRESHRGSRSKSCLSRPRAGLQHTVEKRIKGNQGR